MEIGVVGRAHGIIGAVSVYLHNPDSSILADIEEIFLRDGNGKTRSLALTDVRRVQKKYVIRIVGVDNRDQADQIKGNKLLVPRSSLPHLDEDEFYIADLIGAEAFDGDLCIGTVTGSRPQGDVEVVTVTSDTQSIEIPLVEDFVVEIDLQGHKLLLTDTHLLPAYPRKRAPRPKK